MIGAFCLALAGKTALAGSETFAVYANGLIPPPPAVLYTWPNTNCTAFYDATNQDSTAPVGRLSFLNTSGSAPLVTGSVYGTNSGVPWVATLTACFATNTLPSAQYTMRIPPDTNSAPPTNSPGGDGYALIMRLSFILLTILPSPLTTGKIGG